MKRLTPARHADLLVGPEHGSDAGVFRLTPELAIVQTADFFPPNLSDARAFGMVAAANALSDIYAMGGRPVTALNLLATPKDESTDALVAMMQGAQEKVEEAGAYVVGGHTILSNTVMFGLSVTGVVHPDRVLRNTAPRAGDVLLLTKPLGTGIMIHAYNADQAGEDELYACIDCMTTLNRSAGEMLADCGASAATDITGFGLLGHALDMLSLGQVGFEIEYQHVPQLQRVAELALAGNYPAGSGRNAEYTDARVRYAGCPPEVRLVLNDAQTSGGLLIALPEEGAQRMLAQLAAGGYPLAAVVIGHVTAKHAGMINVLCL